MIFTAPGLGIFTTACRLYSLQQYSRQQFCDIYTSMSVIFTTATMWYSQHICDIRSQYAICDVHNSAYRDIHNSMFAVFITASGQYRQQYFCDTHIRKAAIFITLNQRYKGRCQIFTAVDLRYSQQLVCDIHNISATFTTADQWRSVQEVFYACVTLSRSCLPMNTQICL